MAEQREVVQTRAHDTAETRRRGIAMPRGEASDLLKLILRVLNS